jgi:putative membrane protein
MDIISLLPTIEAILNTLSAISISTGYYFIRQNNIAAHRTCMVTALAISTVFFTVYLIYHLNVGNIPFAGQGMVRPIYFTILTTHVMLAATTVVLVITTVTFIVRGHVEKHKKLAKWTLPIWLYVSVTGVIIYLMAFHFYPATN